jgi:hypothetical protein
LDWAAAGDSLTADRKMLVTTLVSFALASLLFVGDDPAASIWFMRGYLYVKCHQCPTCFKGRECDRNLWTIQRSDVPAETLNRIPFQKRT